MMFTFCFIIKFTLSDSYLELIRKIYESAKKTNFIFLNHQKKQSNRIGPIRETIQNSKETFSAVHCSRKDRNQQTALSSAFCTN